MVSHSARLHRNSVTAKSPKAEELHGSARPFLKWAGGKRKLLPILLDRVPERFGRYHEPFIGGGAFFFELANRFPSRVKTAALSDISDELINAYRAVQGHPTLLMKNLDGHRLSERYYYQVRGWDRSEDFAYRTAIERASRFIFLNHTCYNGLHRVNRSGQFNVPFGKYKRPRLYDREVIMACSKVLQKVQLQVQSFTKSLEKVKRGDFVYLDPPYVPLNPTSNFTAYSANGFGPDDQRKLFELCKKIDSRGAYFILSNSSAELVHSLYSKKFAVDYVQMPRAINRVAAKRNPVAEIIVSNF